MSVEKTCLSPHELAARWDLHPITIYKMCLSGAVPSFKLRKNRRIPIKAIERIEACDVPIESAVPR